MVHIIWETSWSLNPEPLHIFSPSFCLEPSKSACPHISPFQGVNFLFLKSQHHWYIPNSQTALSMCSHSPLCTQSYFPIMYFFIRIFADPSSPREHGSLLICFLMYPHCLPMGLACLVHINIKVLWGWWDSKWFCLCTFQTFCTFVTQSL